MTYKRRTTFRRAFARLFPCVLFCLAVTGMVGASELLAEREILFPEAAAIAVLAMLLPAPALASYPLQVLCATAVYVGCAYLCFHSLAEKKRAALLPALLAP